MNRIGLGLVIFAAACSSGHKATAIAPDEAKSLLIDRNWIDVMPQTRDDKLHVYRFVPSMGGGVFQDRTIFKGTFELFSFTATGDTISFDLHQTQNQVKSHFRIEPVDGPKPFDLKLVIDEDPRGPKTYFGVRAETDRDGHALEADLAAAAH
jgi:hypothetical protein